MESFDVLVARRLYLFACFVESGGVDVRMIMKMLVILMAMMLKMVVILMKMLVIMKMLIILMLKMLVILTIMKMLATDLDP